MTARQIARPLAPLLAAWGVKPAPSETGPSCFYLGLWLFAHLPPETLAKEAEYYTPDQIDAWMAANPNVSDGSVTGWCGFPRWAGNARGRVL